MKICVPINNAVKWDMNTDISDALKFLVFDVKSKEYKVIDVFNMNLGEKIKYLVDNDIMHLIAIVSTPQEYKYILGKYITLYLPEKEASSVENIHLLLSNKLEVDKAQH